MIRDNLANGATGEIMEKFVDGETRFDSDGCIIVTPAYKYKKLRQKVNQS